jgi:hypothetical protein
MGGILMKRKIFIIILLLSTPIIFFWAHRFLGMISHPERPESLKSEITGALMSGYGASIGLWFLFRKAGKTGRKKISNDIPDKE